MLYYKCVCAYVQSNLWNASLNGLNRIRSYVYFEVKVLKKLNKVPFVVTNMNIPHIFSICCEIVNFDSLRGLFYKPAFMLTIK